MSLILVCGTPMIAFGAVYALQLLQALVLDMQQRPARPLLRRPHQLPPGEETSAAARQPGHFRTPQVNQFHETMR